MVSHPNKTQTQKNTTDCHRKDWKPDQLRRAVTLGVNGERLAVRLRSLRLDKVHVGCKGCRLEDNAARMPQRHPEDKEPKKTVSALTLNDINIVHTHREGILTCDAGYVNPTL